MSSDADLLRRLREGRHPASALGEGAAARVEALRAAGYEIEEHPHLGYRLLSSPDRLVADDILSRLPPLRFVREVIVLERTGSTNDFAANFGRQGLAEGVVVFAEEQTAGRGRLGRAWESEARAGLWFSLLARPAWPLALWPRLTLWAAWAAARGVAAATGLEVELKWPNDLYARGCKLAGVLAESSPAQGNAFAVVGLGLNVNQTRFPEPLSGRATSLRLETGAAVDRVALAAAVLEALDGSYPLLPGHFDEILEWARRVDCLRGKWVTVALGSETCEGTACGLDDEGALLLEDGTGPVRRLSSGEVTRIRASHP